MGINYDFQSSRQGCQPTSCPDTLGCPSNISPDFVIRRHDTKPPFKVALDDCDGPFDLQGLVIEVNMWALAKLKKNITSTVTQLALADSIGFEQIMAGDIILVDRSRAPEYMLVTGFDEDNQLINVQRGYRSSTPGNWKKGTKLRIFRTLNSPAQSEVIFDDIPQIDGTVLKDQLTSAFLVYEWKPEDTCMPGCYWLEFKILKMKDIVLYLPGGNWEGPVNRDQAGNFWTGSGFTDSSVLVSYDSVNNRYLLPTHVWVGVFHLASDHSYYTGSVENDGSVLLDRTEHASGPDVPYEPVSNVSAISTISTINVETQTPVYPSTDPSQVVAPSQIAEFYGCLLGEGVEWARRIPIDGEGFLIKVTDSPTREV